MKLLYRVPIVLLALFGCAHLSAGGDIKKSDAPLPREKVDTPCCDGNAGFVNAQEPAPGKPWLGRAIPLKQYDYGRFRAVVGTDGKTRYFPRIGRHVDTALRAAPIPPAVNNGTKAPLCLRTMLGNDQQGCCVLSSRGHRLGIAVAADTGKDVPQTAAECLKNYHEFCGAGDNGCNMSSVNKLEQSKGILYNGTRHKTDGAVSVDNASADLIKTCLIVFGNLEVGIDLPNEWYQSDEGGIWDVTNSGIVGGHEVQAYGYNATGVLISTWGGSRTITWKAFQSTRWVTELYTTLAPDWYGADGIGASGIDVKTLKADLALIANGQIPPLPDPTPGPDPVGNLALIATPSAGVSPLTVTFIAKGNAAGATLDYGDGTPTTTTIPSTHVYSKNGNYAATIKTTTEVAVALVRVTDVPVPPPVGDLGPVTVDQKTGTITFTGPWKVKGGVVPSLAAELLDSGVPQSVIDAVIVLINATKKQAEDNKAKPEAKPGPGGWYQPRRRYDKEPILAV